MLSLGFHQLFKARDENGVIVYCDFVKKTISFVLAELRVETPGNWWLVNQERTEIEKDGKETFCSA